MKRIRIEPVVFSYLLFIALCCLIFLAQWA